MVYSADAQAIVTACAFFSLGLTLLGNAGLLMGGTPWSEPSRSTWSWR